MLWLLEELGVSEGLVGARVLNREGTIVASLVASERNDPGDRLTGAKGATDGVPHVERRDSRLLFAAPIRYNGVRIGEAQIELDLEVLVDPVVRNNRRQLTSAAMGLLALGVFAGMIFVALLVAPLKSWTPPK